MAHVRKTDRIWTDISDNIKRLFATRREHAADWHRYELDKDQFDEACWRYLISDEQKKLMEQLGERFFPVINNTTHTTLYISDDRDSAAEYRLEIKAGSLVPITWISSTYYQHKNQLQIKDPLLVSIANRRKTAMTAVTNEQQALLEMAKSVWAQVASVNAFVKTWEAGRELLNHDVRQELDRKNEKQEKVVIDQSHLNQLSAKLLQAKVAQ